MQTGEPFTYRLHDFRTPEAMAVLCPPPPPLPPLPVQKDGDYGGIGWRVIAPPVPVPDAAAPPPRRNGIRGALGLSQGHKCTHPFVLEVAEGGGIITIRQPSPGIDVVRVGDAEEEERVNLLKVLRGIYDSPEDVEESGKRGRISDFSPSSRRNFRRFMAGMELDCIDDAVFVTLTYPDQFPAPESDRVYKGHLRAFKARVARRFPLLSFVWKLEFQERGAAHYHIVVFGIGRSHKDLAEWRAWCDQAWFEIVNSGDINHLSAGCSAERVRSKGGISWYLASYVGKNDQTRPGDFTGRYWGCFNKGLLPRAPVSKLRKTDQEAIWVRRVFRRKMEADVNARRRSKLLQQTGWAEFGATWMDVEAWHRNPGCDRFLTGGQWSGPSRLSLPNPDHKPGVDDSVPVRIPFKMPWKYKTKNNYTVTLFCDASKVAAQLEKWLKTFEPDEPF